MKRKIVIIDENKCNGCGECIPNCQEGAIQLIGGKAKLLAEKYCDGLGACLGTCPMDAIIVEEREVSEDFDEKAVKKHLESQGKKFVPVAEQVRPLHAGGHASGVCPSSATRTFHREAESAASSAPTAEMKSELMHWPVQLCLVAPSAPFLQNSHLLIAADCVPFAYANFHQRFLKDKALLIGCPKLDDIEFYREKLTEIFKHSNIKKVSIVHMEVPCCFGLESAVKQAIQESGKDVPFERVIVSVDGNIRQ